MENKDNIIMPTPGRAPIFEEPALDVLADEASKKIKEKNKADLTANDQYILDLVDKLPLKDLFQKGYMEVPLDICDGIQAVFRSMSYTQIESIAHDVSIFQQQKDLVKADDGIEREAWRPSIEEVRIFQIKRTLIEMVPSVAGQSTGGTIQERTGYFNRLDHMFVNALYRRAQQFLTALSLLFPSENQKEYVSTLKKVSAPRP